MIHSPVHRIIRLIEPGRIGPLYLKNRMCLPAMHLNFTMGGQVSAQMEQFYAERARGGVAMITVGGCSVDLHAGGFFLLGLHEDKFLPGLSRLTAAIHDGGALAVAQLYHAGKYAYSNFIGRQAVSASALPSKLTHETPRELSIEEIAEVQAHFADAARRAVQAGFDGVEVLAGAGYLIAQFLSPVTNVRQDAYGGSFENRVRFGREVVQRVREAVGPERAVLVRVAGADFVPGGHGVGESARVCQALVAAGADAINVTGGWHETHVPQLTMGVPRGTYLYLARRIREAVSVPVIASNRLSDPRLAEAALRDGAADFINLARPLIADPELPNKVMAGQPDEVVRCVACNQGCFDHVFLGKPITCMVNPRAGREHRVQVSKAERPKRVLVVGGGPGGMMAALTAARRGHAVTLMERQARLGGQLRLASATTERSELGLLVQDIERQIVAQGVRVQLGTAATVETILKAGPEAVVLATGARPKAGPDIPGVDLPHVVQAWEVLAGDALLGRRVVVVGGGPVAVDTARELSQRGTLDGESLRFLFVNEAETPETLRTLCLSGTHQVTLVEMKPKAGEGIGKSTRWSLMQDLERFAVQILVETRVTRITPEAVEVQSPTETTLLPADSVVLALGADPNEALLAELQGQVEPLLVIGDAKGPRRAFDAIHEGFEAAMSL